MLRNLMFIGMRARRCGYPYGCAAVSSVGWVRKSHWLDVWGFLVGIVRGMGSVMVGGWVIGTANLHIEFVIIACPIHQLQPSLVISKENLFS